MAYKDRIKPELLRIYEILLTRTKISKDAYYYFLNLKKGFDGESLFDEYTKQFKIDHLFLNDLQLEVRNSSFQIDALMISTKVLVLYEIKNFEGLYHWGKEKFTRTSGTFLENPTMQLEKTKVRLELLLLEKGYSLKVEAYVIFVNPEFTLLGAPSDANFILPSQILGHFRNVQAPAQLNAEQIKLAEMLANQHDPIYPRKNPQYNYSDLSKGIICPECGTLSKNYSGYFHSCNKCGKKVNVKKAIQSSIEDFRTLFPKDKLTSSCIMDWCSCGNQKRIYRILRNDYQMIGKNRGRYYG
ncbi:nuclease-related domain-containing protein [uncultured Trichococcus sp.]|uniref:nuclease-related domain-containing protein n=1 Tax=uncultured Trichococcus sp. TaxID=189665 RepID=UPI0029C68D19|nr:nuclease-related domain-containing protein [uncultured Trichococcus sp.]